jgi:putative ABC transport system permease protein
VRVADILGLALSALWQQKARTLLTTLGVVFGSFVLAASLSISQGVQETIERESHLSDFLRRIDVRPKYEGSTIPVKQPRVTGNMSDARRDRIRAALVARKLLFNPNGPPVALTRDRLHGLSKIEHVEAVVPVVRISGWALLERRSEVADMASTKPDNASLRKRVVAGRFFDGPEERAAVVSELLLYRLGIADEAAVSAVVGKKLRLEYRANRYGVGLGIYLVKPGGVGPSGIEAAALDKLKSQLPRALDKLDLSPAERDALRNALREAPPRTAAVYAEDLPIVGVVRLASADEQKGSWDPDDADVLLPLRAAEDLFFRAPAHRERGVDQVTLYVDRQENVEAVLESVQKTGLNAYAGLEHIQRQRLMYLLIFGAMTCVAGVALLVSALGIANTMLMSVLERTREVGIMKAVGAANSHIQMIFLVEGALTGLVGGGLGLLLGWAASLPGDAWVRSMVLRDLKVNLKESLFVFPPWLGLCVVSFAVLVTTLAAIYPARRAARLHPVTALRHE